LSAFLRSVTHEPLSSNISLTAVTTVHKQRSRESARESLARLRLIECNSTRMHTEINFGVRDSYRRIVVTQSGH